MKFKADRKFFDQAKKYSLVHTCEYCAYFNTEEGKCVHKYPNEVHRSHYYESFPKWIVPCKDFELI